jgi:hypothetical protein
MCDERGTSLFHFACQVMPSLAHKFLTLFHQFPHILHSSFTFYKKVMRRGSFTLLSLFIKSDDIINKIDERGTSLCLHFAGKMLI